MIDYEDYKIYLQKIGFSGNSLNTYPSYISQNKLDILTNIEGYIDLSDDNKLIKFSNENNNFKEIFDTNHDFKSPDTFSDLRSGARRYKHYLQYKAIIASMTQYDSNKLDFDLNNAYIYFQVFNNSLYPLKAVCKPNISILELKSDFTTNDGRTILKKIFNMKGKENIKFKDTKEKHTNKKNTKIKNSNFNQILYGPPGTGKTYNTINKALEIIFEIEDTNQKFEIKTEQGTYDTTYLKAVVNKDRGTLTAIFDLYKKAGQIEFVTFHQSFGYEEFVEGIKAETTEKENIKYELEAGIFKKLSKEAIQNYNASKKTTEQLIKEKTLEQKINIFLNDCLENQVEFTKTKGGKFKIQNLSKDEIILYTEDSNYNDKTLRIQRDELFTILDTSIVLTTSRQIAKEIFGIDNQRQKDTYYLSIYKKFNKTIFEDKIEVINEEPLKNYILIIDEINRGNISKIFGELITLIEPSKRIGEEEEIRVRLPYSGEDSEPFGVPSNLYIIGTMNTADRSIAQIDTALRRRFVFEEMMPKPDLLKDIVIEDSEINVVKILEAINERIEYIYDREHTIGHSYFLPLHENPTKNKLDDIFRVNIIPLLAEYFYGDWADIEFILNNDFIQEKKKRDYIKETPRELNRVYEINKNFETSEYVKIYNGVED